MSESLGQDIEVVEEDSMTIRVQVRDAGGNAFDLTSFQAHFIVKENLADADANAKIVKKSQGLSGGHVDQIEILDQSIAANKGVMLIKLLPADTEKVARDYLYSVKILNVSPTTKRHTVANGTFRIKKSLAETIT